MRDIARNLRTRDWVQFNAFLVEQEQEKEDLGMNAGQSRPVNLRAGPARAGLNIPGPWVLARGPKWFYC